MNLRDWDTAKRIERERVHFSLDNSADSPELDPAEIERETGLDFGHVAYSF